MLGVWERGAPQENLPSPEEAPTYQSDGSGKRNGPATVESSAACNRAPKKKKRKKKSSRQGKPANIDKEGWVYPKRTSPVTEAEETSVVEVNNPYQPLETKVTEVEEFCPSPPPPPVLPEKRKPTRQPPNSKKESKGKNRPASGRGRF